MQECVPYQRSVFPIRGVCSLTEECVPCTGVCSLSEECVHCQRSVFSVRRVCSLSEECVHCQKTVFTVRGMCPLSEECVHCQKSVFSVRGVCSLLRRLQVVEPFVTPPRSEHPFCSMSLPGPGMLCPGFHPF